MSNRLYTPATWCVSAECFIYWFSGSFTIFFSLVRFAVVALVYLLYWRKRAKNVGDWHIFDKNAQTWARTAYEHFFSSATKSVNPTVIVWIEVNVGRSFFFAFTDFYLPFFIRWLFVNTFLWIQFFFLAETVSLSISKQKIQRRNRKRCSVCIKKK